MKRLAALFPVLLMLGSMLPAAGQQAEPVDVELVLAVDVSRSMTPNELEIQRRGYASALVSQPVMRAIRNGLYGQVALLYMEWAGTDSQRIVVDWTLIRGRGDAEAFAQKLAVHVDPSFRRTSIAGALDFASGLFDRNRYDGVRRVIDVSGDGPNNQGRPVTAARDDVLARGIIVNGLPLMTREGMGSQWYLEDLDRYYYHCVIGGPGAFVMPVQAWEHFPEAVRRKLVLELAGLPPPPVVRAEFRTAEAQGYDCLVGEKVWDSLIGDTQ